MANFTRISLLLVFMFWTTGSNGAAFSIEEEIRQLKGNYIQMEDAVKSLKGKVTELESKNVQLEEKDAKMEEKVTQLETKIKEQENILTFLSKSAAFSTSATGSQSILNKREIAIQSTGRSGNPRTCRELRSADPTLSSGMHWIDPDGQGVGDDPIFVYCDMAIGSTSIVHNSETPIDVGHCADPGCYSRAVNYNSSMGQIESLIALSSECHQEIKYDCNFAPFELNNVAYAWWNDRKGNAQYFWAGNNTDGVHTCQCGINGNCVESSVKCNCDTGAPIQLVDEGFITDKNVLPVTRLNFGRTQLSTSSGIHTLGRFECTGTVAIAGLPTSCEDLWLIGHTLNGLYFVMEGELIKNVYCDFTKMSTDAGFQSLIGYAEVKPKPTYFGMPTSCANLKGAGHTSSGLYLIKGVAQVETVFCDFSKMPTDSGFQTWIGYVDVKSSPVYFYGQRTTSFTTVNAVIPFDRIRLNVGNALNSNGVFVAPKSGKYFFSFSTISNGNIIGRVDLQMKSATLDWSKIAQAFGQTNYVTLTLQSTLQLTKGDQIRLILSEGGFCDSSSSLYGPYAHFVGWILEEDLF